MVDTGEASSWQAQSSADGGSCRLPQPQRKARRSPERPETQQVQTQRKPQPATLSLVTEHGLHGFHRAMMSVHRRTSPHSASWRHEVCAYVHVGEINSSRSFLNTIRCPSRSSQTYPVMSSMVDYPVVGCDIHARGRGA